ASFSLLRHAPRADNWFQLRKNCFLARGSEDPDTHFAVAEIQYRRGTSNAVPQPEVGTAIEFDTGDFQTIEKLNGNFVQHTAQHHRRKAPSRGELDQHRLAGFQNFGLEVRFIDINCSFHVHCTCRSFSNRLHHREKRICPFYPPLSPPCPREFAPA